MRKALTSGALALVLGLGLVPGALAQTETPTGDTQQTTEKDDSGKLGLLGLLGLGGLAGLARRDRNRADARSTAVGTPAGIR